MVFAIGIGVSLWREKKNLQLLWLPHNILFISTASSFHGCATRSDLDLESVFLYPPNALTLGICFSLSTKCPHTKIQEPSLVPLPLELFLFLVTHQAFVSLWLLDINIFFRFYCRCLPYDSIMSLLKSLHQPGFQSSSLARIHVFNSHSSIHMTVMMNLKTKAILNCLYCSTVSGYNYTSRSVGP